MPETPWILFDIGGVLELVDDDAWQDEWWQRWSVATGTPRTELDARVASADLPPIDVTAGTEAAFWDGLASALRLDDAQRIAMRADFWDAYCGTGNTELIEYARSLKGMARTAILSNSADGAREEEERRFGFSAIFDPICYSHEQGVNKPDPQSYRRALARMRADAGQVLFIDDHQVSVDGAEAVGISAILHRGNAATIEAIELFLRERA